MEGPFHIEQQTDERPELLKSSGLVLFQRPLSALPPPAAEKGQRRPRHWLFCLL